MFMGARSFNQPLNNWNVSNVMTTNGMFDGAESFNQPLNNWNVSKVRNMESMFSNATSFNQPLNNWNVSNVTVIGAMFCEASSFNQPLNDWDVSNVDHMYVFDGATSTTRRASSARPTWPARARPTSRLCSRRGSSARRRPSTRERCAR